MAVVVFDCPLDEKTLQCIQDLRRLRLEVLKRQVIEIDTVLEKLKAQCSLAEDEKDSYRDVILYDLREQCDSIEQRLLIPDTIYSEELELYVDILCSR